MTEYNFKPDYEKWWSKKDLTLEELSILIFGFNPDQYLKFEEILSNPNRTEEERVYLEKFNDGISENKHYSIDFHFTEQCADLRRRNLWGNGKKDFINNVYEQGMMYAGYFMHPDFLNFLASIKEKPTHFDHYEDHSQYTCDLEKRISEGVTSEDDAIALLFGVEPKWFSRFSYCYTTPYENQSSEDKFFQRQYWVFLKLYYQGVIDSPISLLDEAKSIKDRKFWGDNFGNFVQSLYNEGYIFRLNVRSALAKYGLTPTYRESGKIYRFYKLWVDRLVWTFDEALHLIFSHDPSPNCSNIFCDLASTYSHAGLKYPKDGKELKWMAHNHQGELVDVKDLAERHIQAKKLLMVQDMRFKAVDFVKWFLNNFKEQPAPILLEMLGLDGSNKKRQNIQMRCEEILKDLFKKTNTELDNLGLHTKPHLRRHVLDVLRIQDEDLTQSQFNKWWEGLNNIPKRFTAPGPRKRT